MDKKGVMVEEWKTRRKEWKKKRWKKGMGKSGFGKSPFCFCLTVSLPLPFFSLHPPHHHATTHTHTFTTHHTTRRICAHHHMQTGPCAVLPFDSHFCESRNDLVGMVCAWDAFVEEGSAIDTILIQHSLLECTSPVFC